MDESRDLEKLLQNLAPEMGPEEYVFVTVRGAEYGDLSYLAPRASIAEKEGLTLVLDRVVAAGAGLPCDTVLRCISLGVHSSLEAVGLTAAVSAVLSEKGISANMIAGCHHDHVFVPAARADEALAELLRLAKAR